MELKREKQAICRYSSESNELVNLRTGSFLDSLEAGQMYSTRGMFKRLNKASRRRKFNRVLDNNHCEWQVERTVGKSMYYAYLEDAFVIKGDTYYKAYLCTRTVYGVKRGTGPGASTILGSFRNTQGVDDICDAVDAIFRGLVDSCDAAYEAEKRKKAKNGGKGVVMHALSCNIKQSDKSSDNGKGHRQITK